MAVKRSRLASVSAVMRSTLNIFDMKARVQPVVAGSSAKLAVPLNGPDVVVHRELCEDKPATSEGRKLRVGWAEFYFDQRLPRKRTRLGR